MSFFDSEATRSTLTSVSTTLSANINASQDYIPVTSTSGFSTSVDAEIETTNEVVSFASITSNQLTHSEEFDDSSWTKSNSSVTADSTTAPNGTTTADTLTESVNTGTQQIYETGGLPYTANTVSTWSIFLKNNTRRYAVVICANGSTNWFYAAIDLQTGLQTGSGSGATGTFINFSISDEGSGWYRCALTGSTQGATNIFPKIILSDVANPTITSFGNYSRTGDGTSSIFIWGAQFESTSSATGYLPTSGSALQGLTTVTRGVKGTTAQAASSGDAIQQLPFAFQKVTAGVSTTTTAAINATQDYIPVTSTSGFSTGVATTVAGTNEQFSFATITKNFYEHSQEFNQGYWQKNNTAVNTTPTDPTAPDGTSTAQGLLEDSATSAHNFIRNSLTTVIGKEYVISIFAKWTGQRYLQIATGSGDVATNPHQNFDIQNGVLGSSAGAITGSITDAGNGWYRCSVVVTSAVTTGFIPVYALVPSTTSNRAQSYTGQGSLAGDMLLLWGAQFEETNSITGYLPTGATAPTFGFTTVTRGINGTTAQSASSGVAVSQAPSFTTVDAPIRLYALSVCSDGGGAGRLTLCDQNGDSLCDVDFPDDKTYDLNFGGGIIFPNGIYVSNTDNLTSYTLFTDKIKGGNLTPGG